jgi:hypothetical protein
MSIARPRRRRGRGNLSLIGTPVFEFQYRRSPRRPAVAGLLAMTGSYSASHHAYGVALIAVIVNYDSRPNPTSLFQDHHLPGIFKTISFEIVEIYSR